MVVMHRPMIVDGTNHKLHMHSSQSMEGLLFNLHKLDEEQRFHLFWFFWNYWHAYYHCHAASSYHIES